MGGNGAAAAACGVSGAGEGWLGTLRGTREKYNQCVQYVVHMVCVQHLHFGHYKEHVQSMQGNPE